MNLDQEDRRIPITDLWPFETYITLEDVMRAYPPKDDLVPWEPTYGGPVVAIGRAVYETQPQEATDHLLRLQTHFARSIAPGNLWMLPTYERMPYPYAVYWPLGNAFHLEKKQQRRFDWFVWMDDDVLVSPEDIKALMAVADPVERPFVSALPYDRFEPHMPAVTEAVDGQLMKWVKAPKTGTYPCFHVGLCLAVFHRSLFDRVPEPWFAAMPPIKGFSGVAPDWWWCYQMNKANITPHVCCDANVIHLGRKLHVNREFSEQWNERSPRRDRFPDAAKERRTISTVSGAEIVRPIVYPDGRSE